MSMMPFALLPLEGGHESGGHEAVWVLPMSTWAYGGIALGAFLLLLLIAWFFRNSGHTLMTGPDTVEHHAGATTDGRHAAGAHTGGHGSSH